jgi:hypothetical protein
MPMVDLPPQYVTLLLVTLIVLLLILTTSILSRPRVFTQYLEHMTGIKLSPRDVARVFKRRGRPGVRDMFLELIIREDLRDSPRITPDTPPDRGVLTPADKRKK